MTRRLALVALWIAATAFAVLLASFAVRLAGDNVIAQGPVTVTRDEVEADLSAVPGTAPTMGTPAPTDTVADPSAPPPLDGAGAPPAPAPSTTSAPTPTPIPSPNAATGPAPAPPLEAPVGEPDRSNDSIPPTTTTPGPGAPVPVIAEQSFPLVGGSVRVRCVDATASLVSSSPNQGFAMEVRSSGPREVEVRFVAAGHTSELKASCAAGRVVAEPKESGEDDD